ncbi:MAG: Glu-tRNA(Gln) amidotransferase subunit GatD [archaeon]
MRQLTTETLLKKFGCKPEEVVKLKTKNGEFEGTIIPTESKTALTLKLKNGYNVGIGIGEIVAMEKLNEHKKLGKPKAKELAFNPALPTISILQIGGTISSRVNYKTGIVETSFDPKDLITMYPELEQTANFNSKLVGQMYSEDMRFDHYPIIAKAIEEEIKKGGIRGIILPHGTDTMGFTAAALSFMLENPPIPIILVGSQRSTDRGSSDAALNLLSAAEFITKTDFTGIGICMHESSEDKNCVILPATKTRKLHTSRRDAFKAVNETPIARINHATKEITFLKKSHQKFDAAKKFLAKTKMEPKVAIIKCHPNMFPEQFDFYRKQKYKGLVIEGTGLGQAPIGVPNKEAKMNEKNFLAIQKLVKSGCIAVMASQCIFGAVQMNVYNNAISLKKIGVIPGKDMLPETAFIKLAWLLGNYPKEKAAEMMQQNLRGEINERTQMNNFNLSGLEQK